MKQILHFTAMSVWLAFSLAQASLDKPVEETPEVTLTYAQAGDPSAQFNCALRCQKGEGAKADLAQAVMWYRKAAAAGFPQAQYNLAVLLANGDGVPQDDKEAAKWFAAAAFQGVFEAQKAILVCFATGRGVEKSPEKALAWDFTARRTLELRFEQNAPAPPKPAVLRADGFAEYTAPGGQREAVGPDGSIERIGADGVRMLERPDGGRTVIAATGVRTTTYPDGHVVTEHPDGRKVTRDRNGTTETQNPDGTRETEGDGTADGGRKVRITDKFDHDGKRLSRRVLDGTLIYEELPDGTRTIETPGEDELKRKVRVIEHFEKGGVFRERQLVREDGVEHTGADVWVVTRWLRQRDGSEQQTRQRFVSDNGISSEEVLGTRRPEAPAPPPPAKQTAVSYTIPTQTISQPVSMPVPPPQVMILRPGGQSIPALSPTPRPVRVKVPIDQQLAELAKLERATRYFAGATAAQYESAQRAAQQFVFELPLPPQKPLPAGVPAPRFALRGTAPPLPAFTRLATDRTEEHPLGMHGRTAIKLHPWQHTETEHFVVHYLDPREAYSVMADIECTFINVTQTLQLDPATVRLKSHVFIFPDAGAWKAFKEPFGLPDAVAGFAYKSELYLGARAERDKYLRTLCHEAAHAVVARFYPARKWPLWLNEGFAEYMSAKQLELRLNAKPDPRATPAPTWHLAVDRVFYRDEYGPGSAQVVLENGAQVNGTALFYAESERCVRALLEKLPPRSFPRFANLAFAGNPMPVCLRGAYGEACASVEKFETLANQR